MNGRFLLLLLGFSSAVGLAADAKLKPEVAEFIFVKAPFQECHASTIVELSNGDLLAAWFGGRREGAKSVGIWLSRKTPGGTWSLPSVVASYKEAPTWNPVLFRDSKGVVWLFFKVGPMEESWVGAYRTSLDGGKTWSEIAYLPAGLLGPVRNKPIILANGNILAGSSREAGMLRDESHPQPYWSLASWAELSEDGGKTWTIHGPIVYPGVNYGLIQPTLWESAPGHIKMLLRSTELIGYICESSSSDGGRTWTPAKRTSLPNPDSGIDAVRMKDGTIALVYNHTQRARSPLNLTLSRDDGETWGFPYVLEDAPGEYSYPAIIQSRDGKLHIAYTWKRKRIKHVVIDPNDIPKQ